ncbi:DegT/DnrJ/EryC1/StrS family aminotransferase [Alphaproteobacteria bacterium]|nr:DegT/DnrJ/EryC1/StrS family aminotransferase [Alphaproteobacteria bacterium]
MKKNFLYKSIKNEWQKFHSKKTNKKIKLHEPTFGVEEIFNFTKQLITTNVTMGKQVESFEKNICDKFGFRYAVSSNSGSSANLLMISALMSNLYSKRLKKNDEIIVPALAWSTSIFPLTQYGLKPVFVDCDLKTMNIDINQVKKAISKKTKGILIIPIYGNPCEMNEITKICKKKGLVLLEDTCESMGAKYNNKFLGGFGLASSFSFYFSHHITCLEGGITVTNDYELAEIMKIIRSHGWIRNIKEKEKWIKNYPKIDPNFLFVNEGYNLRLTEPQARMGMTQIKKLDGFIKKRRNNADYLMSLMKEFSDFFIYQYETKRSFHTWFGFTIIIKDLKIIDRGRLCNFLNKNGIETRVIVSGNFTSQPVVKTFKHRTVGNLENASKIMNNGFSIGIHQNLGNNEIKYIYNIFKKFLKRESLL